MLSYQHAYHAGNLADFQKHALLAWMLAYLTDKPKPMTYIETHAGRGLYDLGGDEARKTGEAEAGISRALTEGWLPETHPLRQVLASVRREYGPDAYPGSPLIAETLLRPDDVIHLAELHPAEADALADAAPFAHLHREDGFAMANALCPPMPRRGLLLIDPSFEVKADYDRIPRFIGQIARKWNVGVIALWYPLLADARHGPMLKALQVAFPEALRHEVQFPPARPGHGMVGSGMFVVNPPFGIDEETRRLDAIFAGL
ncbi:23S rRNA (adenine(2030)-N(6))-methyltransferase RlmJ [Paracoccus aminophilus]|nr:23S rRNA (adenine(2030)-N(6))-methyltransferase RlmJ [Paracoccus aminophilus]